jgi:hypothetical protein
MHVLCMCSLVMSGLSLRFELGTYIVLYRRSVYICIEGRSYTPSSVGQIWYYHPFWMAR